MGKRKILVIGQSLPAVPQEVPYDTTMLFDWLSEVGVSKDEAIEMFEFEAVYGFGFLGYDSKGGHLKPTKHQMKEYWQKVLMNKVENADQVWILGNVAKEFFYSMPKTWSCSLKVISTIHPSKRNITAYRKDKESILGSIKKIVENWRVVKGPVKSQGQIAEASLNDVKEGLKLFCNTTKQSFELVEIVLKANGKKLTNPEYVWKYVDSDKTFTNKLEDIKRAFLFETWVKITQ